MKDIKIIFIIIMGVLIVGLCKQLIDERHERRADTTVVHYYIDEDDNATLMKEVKRIIEGVQHEQR